MSASARGTLRVAGIVGVLGGAILTCFSSKSYGQALRVSQPTANTLDSVTNIGRIGNTAVSQGFSRRSQVGAYRGSLPPRQSAQQLLGASQRFSTFGRRSGTPRDLLGLNRASRIQRSTETNWRKRLARSGAARYMRQPPRYQSSVARLVDPTVADLLLQPQALLQTTAFLGPMSGLGSPTGGIRDAVSAKDQAGVSPYTLQSLSPQKERTQSELMASRLELMRERILKEAWQWFKKEDFRRARSAFQSAEMLDRTDPEPRAGMFFCSVAQERYSQAMHNFNRIVGRDLRRQEDPFAADFELPVRYSSARRMRSDIRRFVDFTEARQDSTGLYGALCYFLWHTETRDQAVRAAQKLVQIDPTGSAGYFGRLVLEAAERHGVVATE